MFVLTFAVMPHHMSLYAPVARSPESRAARGRRKAGCPWDNPVCLWQTELIKFYLKSSPSPSGHNRRRRLATDSRQSKRGFGTAVPKTTIEVANHCPLRVCTGQPAFRRPDRRAVAPVVPRRYNPGQPASPSTPLRPCGAQSGVKGQCPLRETFRRAATISGQPAFADQTGEPWHPSCHGGKTPANLQVLYAPARLWRAVRGQGAMPLARDLPPSGGHFRPTSISPTRPASRGTRRATAVKPRPTCKSSTPLRGKAAQ